MGGGKGNERGAAEVNIEILGTLLFTDNMVPDRVIVIWAFLLVTFSKFSCNDDDDDTCGADASTSALPDSSSFACSILDDNKGNEDDDGRPWLAILG